MSLCSVFLASREVIIFDSTVLHCLLLFIEWLSLTTNKRTIQFDMLPVLLSLLDHRCLIIYARVLDSGVVLHT